MAQAVTQTSQPAARRANGGETTRNPLYEPRTDIYEKGDGIVLVAEMPGVAPDGVDVTLERRVLTIRGRSVDFGHEGYQPVYAEYRLGDYERVFTLSEEIDQDGIKATQKDGVLTLVLPKAAPAKARKIKVKTA